MSEVKVVEEFCTTCFHRREFFDPPLVNGTCIFCRVGTSPRQRAYDRRDFALKALKEMTAEFRLHSVSLTCTGVEPSHFAKWHVILTHLERALDCPDCP